MQNYIRYQTINECLRSAGLDILDCRRQGYDDAGAVADRSQVLAKAAKASYKLCASHWLSLTAVALSTK